MPVNVIRTSAPSVKGYFGHVRANIVALACWTAAPSMSATVAYQPISMMANNRLTN